MIWIVGGVCLVVGYYAGSARTYASLGYGSESLGGILSTLRPWFGSLVVRRPHQRPTDKSRLRR